MRMGFSTRWTLIDWAGVVIHSCDSRVNPYFSNRRRARSCWRALRLSCWVTGLGEGAVAVAGAVAAGAVVAGLLVMN